LELYRNTWTFYIWECWNNGYSVWLGKWYFKNFMDHIDFFCFIKSCLFSKSFYLIKLFSHYVRSSNQWYWMVYMLIFCLRIIFCRNKPYLLNKYCLIPKITQSSCLIHFLCKKCFGRLFTNGSSSRIRLSNRHWWTR